jgi:hypothetical protein
MKNVTIALDDETHRKARIRAAELGTSLSALVKVYLSGLGTDSPTESGVRELPLPFHAAPAKDGPPWLVDGKWVYTRDGKPRQPEDILATFEAWPYDDPDYVPWQGDGDASST